MMPPPDGRRIGRSYIYRSAWKGCSTQFGCPVRLLGFLHQSSVESADLANTMAAFSARAARGDRPAQAGRGPGARGERDAAAGCSWSMSLLLSPEWPNQTATATGFVAVALPLLWAHRTVSRLYGRVPQSLQRSPAFAGTGVIIVTAVTTFGAGSGPMVVGIRVRLLLWLWREPRGAPLYLGDSGDGDDAHDDDIRTYSRQGIRRYFVGSLLPCPPNPTNPTPTARSPLPMRSLGTLAASGYRRD